MLSVVNIRKILERREETPAERKKNAIRFLRVLEGGALPVKKIEIAEKLLSDGWEKDEGRVDAFINHVEDTIAGLREESPQPRPRERYRHQQHHHRGETLHKRRARYDNHSDSEDEIDSGTFSEEDPRARRSRKSAKRQVERTLRKLERCCCGICCPLTTCVRCSGYGVKLAFILLFWSGVVGLAVYFYRLVYM